MAARTGEDQSRELDNTDVKQPKNVVDVEFTDSADRAATSHITMSDWSISLIGAHGISHSRHACTATSGTLRARQVHVVGVTARTTVLGLSSHTVCVSAATVIPNRARVGLSCAYHQS